MKHNIEAIIPIFYFHKSYVYSSSGLDWQNYQCYECTRAIGTIFGPAKLCSYTKRYYCEECHADELAVIPARIVYNWDFKEYRICKKAKIFLNALLIEPILDASTFNLNLFDYSSELKTVSTLRKVIFFIWIDYGKGRGFKKY